MAAPITFSFAPLVMLIGIAFLACFAFIEHQKRLRQCAIAIIHEHAHELKIRRAQLTIQNGYGLVDDSRWIKERTMFIDRVIKPKAGGFANAGGVYNAIINAINIATEGFDAPPSLIFAGSDPIEYERQVAASLRGLGWDARATQASGDQGIDVIASKNGIKLVVQCKLYSKPVGNAAVQEIIAGRTFEKADFGAVISNAAFTASAKQLAAASDVFLFHHEQLAELDAICSEGA